MKTLYYNNSILFPPDPKTPGLRFVDCEAMFKANGLKWPPHENGPQCQKRRPRHKAMADTQQAAPATNQPAQSSRKEDTMPRHFNTLVEPPQTEGPQATAKEALTCSLQEAGEITGLSIEYLEVQSKDPNTDRRLPGFKIGQGSYAVIINELPAWLRRKAGLS